LPTEEEVWRQIDHTLVSLKLQQAAKRRERQSETKRKAIYWRNRNNKNAATVPAQFFDLEIEQMREWAATVYQMYDEVRQAQGMEKTPQFVRAVFRKTIIPTIEGRKACSEDFIRNRALRTGASGNPTGSQLEELERQAARLQDEWRQKTEIQAMELEHQEKRALQTPSAQEDVQKARRSTRRGIGVSDPLVAQRTAIIMNIKRSLSGFRGNLSKEIAARLTGMNIKPLPRWNVPDFNAAYRDASIRPRLQTMISKVKVD